MNKTRRRKARLRRRVRALARELTQRCGKDISDGRGYVFVWNGPVAEGLPVVSDHPGYLMVTQVAA